MTDHRLILTDYQRAQVRLQCLQILEVRFPLNSPHWGAGLALVDLVEDVILKPGQDLQAILDEGICVGNINWAMSAKQATTPQTQEV